MGEDESMPNLVESAFLSPHPRVASFPHTLVRSGQSTLRSLSRSLGVKVGLWGERPMFAADGTHYLEPESGRIEGDFALWKLDSNQRYLLERAYVAPDPSFRMFISADISVAVLSRTHDHFTEDQGAPWFGDYISYVCDWLPELRWALIPLEGERGWSIFVGARDCKGLILKVKTEFQRGAIATAHLEDRDGRSFWIDD